MCFEMLLKSLVVWLGMLIFAIANGVLRDSLLIPALGTVPGFVLSGLLLSCLILVTAYLTLPWLGASSLVQLLVVGFGWLALTLVFEFSFGFIRGMTMDELLAAYTFKDGNTWPVVLVATAAAPWIAARLRGLL